MPGTCLGGDENLESLLADLAQRDGVLNFYHGITFGLPILPTQVYSKICGAVRCGPIIQQKPGQSVT